MSETMKRFSRKSSTKGTKISPLASTDYLILVVNKTDYVINKISVDGGSTFRDTAPLGRTCEYADSEQCIREKKYSVVAVVRCGDLVRLVLKGDKAIPNGIETLTGTYDDHQTDCDHGGSIAVFEE